MGRKKSPLFHFVFFFFLNVEHILVTDFIFLKELLPRYVVTKTSIESIMVLDEVQNNQ